MWAESRPRCRGKRGSTRSADRRRSGWRGRAESSPGPPRRGRRGARTRPPRAPRSRLPSPRLDRRIESAEPVDVDVVGAETGERIAERVLDRGRPAVEAEDLAARGAPDAELDAEHGLPAIEPAQ